MPKYIVNKRYFIKGEKQLVSFRMPAELKAALEAISKEKGRSLTDVIISVLDQYARQESEIKKV